MDFDFKNVFLELTEYTVPFGYEETLEPILYKYIPNLKKDDYGNYNITIGNSKSLFTSHLDTYSKRREKVNHIIKKGKIKTDGTTVLGGDNKNGVLILMYMILHNVPGTYYFFKGEEGIVSGESCNGSTWLLKNSSDIITKYDRVVAFDRRGKGSIVTRQRAKNCCSIKFANSLIKEFQKCNLSFKQEFAYGTDSAVFMDIVPEITNISSGGEYEHSFLEATDIKYTKKIAIAATKINWEKLPIVRVPKITITKKSTEIFNDVVIKQSQYTFDRVNALLGIKSFRCINEDNFYPNTEMYFEQFVNDNKVSISVLGDLITIINNGNYINEFDFGTIENLYQHFEIDDKLKCKKVIGYIVKKMNSEYIISKNDLEEILDNFLLTYEQFKIEIKNSEYNEYFQFNGDYIYMDIVANQSTTIKRQQEQKYK